eukprot:sb/3476462/
MDKFHTSEPGSEPSFPPPVQLAPVVVKEGIEEGFEFEFDEEDDEFLDFSEELYVNDCHTLRASLGLRLNGGSSEVDGIVPELGSGVGGIRINIDPGTPGEMGTIQQSACMQLTEDIF